MSASVVASMSIYVSLNELPPEGTGTIEFIERFDKLFDILNSIETMNAKEFNRAYKGLTYQIEFLNNTIQFLDKVKVLGRNNIDVTKRIKCLKGWKITINAVQYL